MLVYFMDICSILRPCGIFYEFLVYIVAIWYIFHVVVRCTTKSGNPVQHNESACKTVVVTTVPGGQASHPMARVDDVGNRVRSVIVAGVFLPPSSLCRATSSRTPGANPTTFCIYNDNASVVVGQSVFISGEK
jgi:hypothetical protein